VAARAPGAAAQFRRAQAQLRAGKRLEAIASFHKATKQGLKEETLSQIDRAGYRELAKQSD
jgi:hypothetical protein